MSYPKILKALNVVELSWLTHLSNVVWKSGTVPVDLQTGKKRREIPPHFQSSVLPQVKISYVSHIK